MKLSTPFSLLISLIWSAIAAPITALNPDQHYLLKTNAILGYSDAYEREYDTQARGNCVDGQPPDSGPDAQTTLSDEHCRSLGHCHVAFTEPMEYVVYEFHHSEDHFSGYDYENFPILLVDVTLRVASKVPRTIQMEIYDDTDELGPVSPSFSNEGLGYQTFEDITWSNVRLEAYNPHRLKVFFLNGGINLCSVTIRAVGKDHRVIPFSINALDFERNYEVDTSVWGHCDENAKDPPNGSEEGAPDAQTTSDAACQELGPCHIGFTQVGEWVDYDFGHNEDDQVNLKKFRQRSVFVDVTVRVASEKRKKFQMQVYDGNDRGPVQDFYSPAKGYHIFEDVTWRMVELRSDRGPVHTLRVVFLEGNVNLCSVTVTKSIHTPPITWSATEYFEANENSLEKYGNCPTGDSVDAQYTSDEICIERDSSACNIGWTEPFENLRYQFYVPDDDDYDIWIRVAANNPGRRVRLVINPTGCDGYGQIFDVPADGWQSFNDLVYELLYLEENSYELVVQFLDGGVNLCSVTVKPSTYRYFVHVPGMFSALFYADYAEIHAERIGDCPDGRPVDAQITQDLVCQEAISEYSFTCNLGWTEPGEFVMYQFQTDGVHEYVDLTFRIASAQKSRTIEVELYTGGDKVEETFNAPGNGWQAFENRVWKSIYIGNVMYHTMYVKFTTGHVNLCSFGVEYTEP